jgi:hypothetical protein
MIAYALKFFGVIIATILVDICWAYYFIKINEEEPLPASTWASLILVFGAFTTINYVDDRSLLIAAVIGSFIGTYATIWYRKRKKAKQNLQK